MSTVSTQEHNQLQWGRDMVAETVAACSRFQETTPVSYGDKMWMSSYDYVPVSHIQPLVRPVLGQTTPSRTSQPLENRMPYCPSVDRIQRIPAAMGMPFHDAHDVAQQAIVACLEYERNNHSSPPSELEGTITRRRCSDHFRARTRYHRLFTTDDALAVIAAPDPGPAKDVEECDTAGFVQEVIADSLPARYSEVLRLTYWEGLSDAQIAGRLGVSQQCVRQQRHRAHSTVKPILEHGLAIY